MILGCLKASIAACVQRKPNRREEQHRGRLTQAVAGHRHGPGEPRVSLLEEVVETVDLGGHRVHDGLAVRGAVVEEEVQQGVVGEVAQPTDTGQSDPLNVPERGREGGSERVRERGEQGERERRRQRETARDREGEEERGRESKGGGERGGRRE